MASEHPGTEHSENKGGLRPTKYFLTLSKDQKKVYRSWIGVQRFIYNRCIAFSSPENDGLKTGKRVVPTIKKLKCVNNEAYKGKALAWVLDHSYDLRDEAARDFFKNVKSSLAKGAHLESQKGQETAATLWKLNERTGQALEQGPRILSIIQPRQLHCKEKPLPLKLDNTCRLGRTPAGWFWIAIPRPVMVASHEEAGTAVFLDPGSRTLQWQMPEQEGIQQIQRTTAYLVTDVHRILINNCQN
ncbi:hypothetical protein EDD86DRAFT_254568 [Gorgonomyces haynaldii]|nr:hypothetical protein EDD86DRAFT_254568 [Gorgonomyces haynaldii]